MMQTPEQGNEPAVLVKKRGRAMWITINRPGKYAMRALGALSFDEGIAYTESQIALLAMASFNERRQPVWTGR
ncbi:MAG: hypothetical protein LBQ32_05685 [Burkholderiaceae bacterium]|jgi:hypothetical protein|nr:hypothetical protein [Burkholderiaceae bacterium]